MAKNILVTGGAGFIGSHLVDALVQNDHSVRVFDNLEPQVHGNMAENYCWPDYINLKAEYILGDVRNREQLSKALEGIEIVYHFSAATGVGQSMYQIAKYTEVNTQGTANLLDILNKRSQPIEKIILASSRAIYGEGLYSCQNCGSVTPPVRGQQDLAQHRWSVLCPNCSALIKTIPTPESKRPDPGSIYAITKLNQEQLCLCFGQAYNVPIIILRFFNVYGPRQSFSNPYTGIITAFIQRLVNGQDPEVYEDGLMTRDFVYVSDVIKACLGSLDIPGSNTLNVGTGQFTSILTLAQHLCDLIRPGSKPKVVELARIGDIRHCSADLFKITEILEFLPSISILEGLKLLIAESGLDLISKPSIADFSVIARNELKRAGLLK